MKRPLLWGLGYYVIGIIISNYLKKDLYFMLFFVITIILFTVIIYKKFNWYGILIFPILFIVGALNLYIHSNSKDMVLDTYLNDKQYANIKGEVKDIVPYIDDKIKLIIETDKIKIDDYTVSKNIRLIGYLKSDNAVKCGDIILLNGYIKKAEIPRNPGQFNEALYFKIKNLDYKFYGSLERVIDSKKIFF